MPCFVSVWILHSPANPRASLGAGTLSAMWLFSTETPPLDGTLPRHIGHFMEAAQYGEGQLTVSLRASYAVHFWRERGPFLNFNFPETEKFPPLLDEADTIH